MHWLDAPKWAHAGRVIERPASQFNGPRSRRRTEALQRSCAILAQHRPPSTPVVVARQVGRDGEDVAITTLAELNVAGIDMLTLVIVGSSQSRRFRHGGRQWMYTPRGYTVADK